MLAERLCWSGLALLATALLLALTAGRGLAQEEPSIVITAPAEGEVLSGSDITVSVALSGFTISLPLEPKREPNRGHIAYFLDVEPFFDLPTPLGDENIIHSGRLSETFVGVADGDHTIYVCLVYDDNTCIDPALTDSVQISMGEPLPPATPSAEATPTAEPPQETPLPPSPMPSPTEEPSPVETPAQTETPPASPTVRPATTVPPTPTATSAPGIAPDTAESESDRDSLAWLYIFAVTATAALAAVAVASVWLVAQARRRR